MDNLVTSTIHDNNDLVIKNLLLQLEKDNNIKIIFAVESGSRVWGMDSKDSDYDIRGVYLDLNPVKRNNLICIYSVILLYIILQIKVDKIVSIRLIIITRDLEGRL